MGWIFLKFNQRSNTSWEFEFPPSKDSPLSQDERTPGGREKECKTMILKQVNWPLAARLGPCIWADLRYASIHWVTACLSYFSKTNYILEWAGNRIDRLTQWSFDPGRPTTHRPLKVLSTLRRITILAQTSWHQPNSSQDFGTPLAVGPCSVVTPEVPVSNLAWWCPWLMGLWPRSTTWHNRVGSSTGFVINQICALVSVSTSAKWHIYLTAWWPGVRAWQGAGSRSTAVQHHTLKGQNGKSLLKAIWPNSSFYSQGNWLRNLPKVTQKLLVEGEQNPDFLTPSCCSFPPISPPLWAKLIGSSCHII